MRYKDFLYDETDVAEISAAPPSFDLGDPLLHERIMLEAALKPNIVEEITKNREQANLVSAIYGILSLNEPAIIELHTSAVSFNFTMITKGTNIIGEPWEGFRSPKLSRLKLGRLAPSEVVGVIGGLWHDRVSWTQYCYGHTLSEPFPMEDNE